MQRLITSDNRRWWALGLIAAAQFMVIMDTSIIGVALPEDAGRPRVLPERPVLGLQRLRRRLRRPAAAGRQASDLLGARRVFIAGWAILLVGVGARRRWPTPPARTRRAGRPGRGAALIAPSALTLLMMLFGASPKELTRRSRSTAPPPRPAGPPGCSSAACITEYAELAVGVLPQHPDRPGRPRATSRAAAGRRRHAAARSTCSARSPSPADLASPSTRIVRAPEVGWASAQTLLPLASRRALLGVLRRRCRPSAASR